MKILKNLARLLKIILPKSMRDYYPQMANNSKIFFSLNMLYTKVMRAKYHYKDIVRSLKNKEQITVAFFMEDCTSFKLSIVYELFKKDSKFNPVVVIIPQIIYGEKRMLDNMARCETLCKDRNYEYVVSYDKDNSTWMDVKKEISPDIIFFLNPWEGLTREEYFITNFHDSLNCYVPYSSTVFGGDMGIELNQTMHNLVWRFFIENKIVQDLSRKISVVKGTNTVVTGFPGLDIYLDPLYKPKNGWKHQQRVKIIWAPHHTIEDNPFLRWSNFLKYYEFFVTVALSHVDTIQIAFKPHPMLKDKLYELWGKERTEAYYLSWEAMPNTQLEESAYEDLFASSDALIFDSCSFITEYLYTKKPSLFLYKDTMEGQFNEFGLQALHCHRLGYGESDIMSFINSLIAGERDPLGERKAQFYDAWLVPPNRKSASLNIFEDIQKVLN
jgi:hypothetical protein